MVAILVCDRFKWTLEEYLAQDSDFVDKVFQFMTLENEERARQNKKAKKAGEGRSLG